MKIEIAYIDISLYISYCQEEIFQAKYTSMPVDLYKSKVVVNKILNYKFHHLTLKTLSPIFSFQTGQFVTMKVGDNIYRSYSIASLPKKLPNWEMFVDITPGGPGSKFIQNLKAGDTIETTLPLGVFALSKNLATHSILIATGCGLAAILPLSESLLIKNGHQVHLFWGLRYQKDICLKETLDELQKMYPNFSYDIILSKPDTKWGGKVGHVTEHVEKLAQNLPPTTDFYLCGNSSMVADVKSALEKIDFPDSRVYFERYY